MAYETRLYLEGEDKPSEPYELWLLAEMEAVNEEDSKGS
jgi:hypothetical protein